MAKKQSKADGASPPAEGSSARAESSDQSASGGVTVRCAAACVLAWIVPGAGHLYLAKFGRAAVFFVAIMGILLAGVALDGKIYQPTRGQFLTYLATFACMGNGPSFFMMKFVGIAGDIRSASFEYGTTFILAAGLLNMLLVLDAYDVSIGRKE